MCGFAGFVGGSLNGSERLSVLGKMGDAIAHRGPDDRGKWVADDLNVGLVHQRLAIIDLSPLGKQPMVSKSGRFVIGFNGEIYNYQTLRRNLRKLGISFSSGTDTEVLLECIEHYGLDEALKRCLGMFAFVLIDKKTSRLYLVRDRFGEKPLYYGRQKNIMFFGSELTAFRAHPSWEERINRDALSDLVRYSYIPDPETIYQDIFKLRPGHLLEFSLTDYSKTSKTRTWWSPNSTLERHQLRDCSRNLSDVTDDLDDILRTVIREQSIADVPRGALLSGGIDSSLIVASLQSEIGTRLKTFTIGYQESEYDESKYARQVAECLGTDHSELVVSSRDVVETITQLPRYYSEPFADTSQIPTAMVSKMAREDVVVALSGDGGDEMFGGYNRYIWGPRLDSVNKLIPKPIREFLGASLGKVSMKKWEQISSIVHALTVNGSSLRVPAEKLEKSARALSANDQIDLYNAFSRVWRGQNPVVNGVPSDLTRINMRDWDGLEEFSEKMMRLDLLTYLPGDILVKVDRASMAHGLEVRAPYLDLRIFEFANQIPLDMKVTGRSGKIVMRELLSRYLPRNLIERPKAGFAIPISSWLRGPLSEWAEDLLSEQKLRSEGFFCDRFVREKWQEHRNGQSNNVGLIWSILMFQAWLAESR